MGARWARLFLVMSLVKEPKSMCARQSLLQCPPPLLPSFILHPYCWALCCPCLYLPASAGAIPYVILYLCWLLHLLSKTGPEKPHNQLSSHHVSGKGCPWRRQLTVPCLLPRSPPATLRHYALVEQGPWLPCPQNKPVSAELNSVCICICLNRVLLCSSG